MTKKEIKKEEKKIEETPENNSGWDFSKTEVTLESMLKSGVHFGHLKSRKNPKMEKYIFGVKNGINIIDLQKSLEEFEKAAEFIKEIHKSGKKILFVGTKKQAKKLVKIAAIECDMPYVTERWLGGTFTNFGVIRGRAKYLNEAQKQAAEDGFAKYTKLERLKKMEEIERLERKMGGIKNMTELPAAIVVVDTKEDHLAIEEARKQGVPVIAIVDTNSDPSKVNYPIPANDDAISSIKLIIGAIAKILIK
ncbi:MAG: 30S ribosomal protein S2 [Candidatus Moranbacteria bacterium]|nr:30S ribosomal protein S2 [Candidatus Moranbacteria bacterium]